MKEGLKLADEWNVFVYMELEFSEGQAYIKTTISSLMLKFAFYAPL